MNLYKQILRAVRERAESVEADLRIRVIEQFQKGTDVFIDELYFIRLLAVSASEFCKQAD